MSDAAGNNPIGVFAREPVAIRAVVRKMRSAIRIPFQCYRRDSDHRSFGDPRLYIRIFRFAVCNAKPKTVIVDDDSSIVRIVEGGGSALKGCVVKGPLGRSELPDEFPK